ncbi:MAG: hypothetical protein ACHP84_17320, partial [Caulobacterales bacterium]
MNKCGTRRVTTEHPAAPACRVSAARSVRVGLAALALAAGATCAATSAQAADLCNNTNGGGVLNGPNSHRTPCTLTQPAHITQLITYHWNNGNGATPGTIMLFDPSTGVQYGPFAATGSSGQGGAPNVNWVANVNLTVPAGAYQVIDSDPPTWSWNSASGNYGFAKVEGDYTGSSSATSRGGAALGGPPPPPPP